MSSFCFASEPVHFRSNDVCAHLICFACSHTFSFPYLSYRQMLLCDKIKNVLWFYVDFKILIRSNWLTPISFNYILYYYFNLYLWVFTWLRLPAGSRWMCQSCDAELKCTWCQTCVAFSASWTWGRLMEDKGWLVLKSFHFESQKIGQLTVRNQIFEMFQVARICHWKNDFRILGFN